jgi:hypothetical protein
VSAARRNTDATKIQSHKSVNWSCHVKQKCLLELPFLGAAAKTGSKIFQTPQKQLQLIQWISCVPLPEKMKCFN